MRKNRRIAAVLLTLLLAAGGLCGWLSQQGRLNRTAIERLVLPAPDLRDDFDDWLAEDATRSAEFAAFADYLDQQGVGSVVEPWQMIRVDAGYARRCGMGFFALPPRELWPNIVPALQLVRDHVIPAIGPVEVMSSFRTPEINQCVHGAGGSKHLGFHALDLAPKDGRREASLYRDLCAMQRAAGTRSGMGLGAYYNLEHPERATGRFHIDGQGYRNWGHDYTFATNPCPALLGQ